MWYSSFPVQKCPPAMVVGKVGDNDVLESKITGIKASAVRGAYTGHAKFIVNLKIIYLLLCLMLNTTCRMGVQGHQR